MNTINIVTHKYATYFSLHIFIHNHTEQFQINTVNIRATELSLHEDMIQKIYSVKFDIHIRYCTSYDGLILTKWNWPKNILCRLLVQHFVKISYVALKVKHVGPTSTVNGKAVPLQASGGPEGSRKLRFPDFLTTAQDGGKVVSPMHWPHLPPENTPGTHFC
jgi:hypothetical protein